MDFLAIACVILAAFLAINVGGNNSATEMGPAFGAGVRTKKEAVILIAVFSMLGAMFAGDDVVQTIASGIAPGSVLQDHFSLVIVILASAASIIVFANIVRIPIATSHAMVGAVVGVGLAAGDVNWPSVFKIVVWWLITPAAALIISYFVARYACPRLQRWVDRLPSQRAVQFTYRSVITVSGCYMAFSAGSNSLAKAVGPIVGANILSMNHAAIMGGLGMALGALIVGHRLLHTVGKGITPIDPLQATLIELICGTILLVASKSGVPISLAETITCSVIGFGAAQGGVRTTLDNKHVRMIYKLWPACPFVTGTLAFVLAWFILRA